MVPKMGNAVQLGRIKVLSLMSLASRPFELESQTEKATGASASAVHERVLFFEATPGQMSVEVQGGSGVGGLDAALVIERRRWAICCAMFEDNNKRNVGKCLWVFVCVVLFATSTLAHFSTCTCPSPSPCTA